MSKGFEGKGINIGEFKLEEGHAPEVKIPEASLFKGIKGSLAESVSLLSPEDQGRLSSLLNAKGLGPEAVGWVPDERADEVSEIIRLYLVTQDEKKRKELAKQIADAME